MKIRKKAKKPPKPKNNRGREKSAEETAVTGWQTKLQSMKERKECG